MTHLQYLCDNLFFFLLRIFILNLELLIGVTLSLTLNYLFAGAVNLPPIFLYFRQAITYHMALGTLWILQT